MKKKTEVNWFRFLSGESELQCESIEDIKILLEVCKKNNIYGFDYLAVSESLVYGLENPYWYIQNGSLNVTKYTLENDDICDCWTVSGYIENHEHHVEETEKKENKKYKLDCSMIRHVRVPHEQFVAIQNKAEYLIVEDRDKGGCISFNRAKEISEEESEKMLEDIKDDLRKLKDEIYERVAKLNESGNLTEREIIELKNTINKGVNV